VGSAGAVESSSRILEGELAAGACLSLGGGLVGSDAVAVRPRPAASTFVHIDGGAIPTEASTFRVVEGARALRRVPFVWGHSTQKVARRTIGI
jgi:hypothetical protein